MKADELFEMVQDTSQTKEEIIERINDLYYSILNNPQKLAKDLLQIKNDYCEEHFICPNCGNELNVINKYYSSEFGTHLDNIAKCFRCGYKIE